MATHPTTTVTTEMLPEVLHEWITITTKMEKKKLQSTLKNDNTDIHIELEEYNANPPGVEIPGVGNQKKTPVVEILEEEDEETEIPGVD